MMKCRLLCALLVLALCCCPSECAEEPPTVPSTKTTAEMSKDKKEPDAQANAGTTNLLTPAPVGKSPVADHSGSSGSRSGDVPGIVDEDGKSLTVMLAQSDDTNDNLQREGNNGTTGSQSSKKPYTEEEIKKGEDTSETTANAKTAPTTKTTTTQAPTTTTTTTAAPVAPSTTTTEAITTTTTRAPSRLREVDGSLSSSAWVCAPLLLAAFALAYTAVG
ncbi:mucin TcMUCII [Trypanosoma cruzi]|uniref:Putative mucin TcMUCII n=1 Tax=Trypanosoma cruzi TaxID=5693 RepID=A0A2V2UQH7_TRYCR|nr:mucin TcMUCII [Trypanosoma cruzi cruzi]PWU86607.1 putative mucin TcMUCII [Trypanosoma cruzi]RNF01389.1 mucin TcMUCII [Trypanosoma cruzi]